MDRRTFHKVMATAVMGSGLNPALGQETGPDIYSPVKLDSVDIELTPKEPLAIGTRKQLFVDRFIVDHTEEVLFTMGRPRKHPKNPLILPEVPSDGQMFGYNSARYDPEKKLFQLWYCTQHFETGKEFQLIAYAESEDGLNWRRPELGARDFNGSTANNLIGGTVGRYAEIVIYDAHDTDPNRRYKCIGTVSGHDVAIWFSPDGIHWIASAKNPLLEPTGDTHSLLGWDERSKKYIGYFRPAGHPETAVHGQRRQIGYSLSDDAENWTPTTPTIVADEHDPPGTEFYCLKATAYEDVYLGVLSVLHLDANLVDLRQVDPAGQEQVVDAQLVCSRDGIHWNRMGNRGPWLSPGPYESWDDKVIWPGAPITVGDEIRVYYAGSSVRHTVPDLTDMGTGKKFEGRTRVGGIGVATLRRDGWVAACPNLLRKGVLTTHRFVLEGSGLEVNADASRGKILVELLGADETPLPGLSGTQAPSVSGDSLRHRLKWGRSLAEFSGQPVRLRFTLENASLYAFQFTT